jgi:hypothetical protein
MEKVARFGVFLAVVAALFFILFFLFKDKEAERVDLPLIADKQQVKVEKKIESVKDSTLEEGQVIKRVKLIRQVDSLFSAHKVPEIQKIKAKQEADSLLKILEKMYSDYDSAGVDSLGRTIYMHKNDARRFK